MKKVLQFVAAALVAVLAAQPALAGLTCGMMPSTAMPCAPKCEMAKDHMGAKCPMHHDDTGTGCLQDCCRNGWPQALVQSSSKARPKAGGTQLFLALPTPAQAGIAAFATPLPEDIGAAAPPRYILLRVFRI
jgi:hypothetical protein